MKVGYIAEQRDLALKLEDMTQRDQFRRTHKEALKMYEKFRAEAFSAGEWVPGWAGKVF